MTSHEQLQKTFELIKLERQADLEYYRQKVLLRSIHERTKEGTTWYPLRFNRDYIGTGERLIIEVERTNHLDQPHAFQSGKSVSVFSNASGKPEKEHVNGVVNYVRDNVMSITLNSDDVPDWIEDGLVGVDVMFDEMSYREMEFALREVMKAEDNRVAMLREILLGDEKSLRLKAESAKLADEGIQAIATTSLLNTSQHEALTKVMETADIAFVHGYHCNGTAGETGIGLCSQ
jgi:hypothetical protein